jgi:malic enzyme
MAIMWFQVAVAVIEKAMAEGLTTKLKRSDVPTRQDLQDHVRRKMYYPVYVPLVDPSL